MSSQPQNTSRLGYIDNLRSTMIIWVVAFHTAITYSHIGSWYYSDPKPVGNSFFHRIPHIRSAFPGLFHGDTFPAGRIFCSRRVRS